MLQPVMHILKEKNIILASSSPRKKELLEHIIDLQVQYWPTLTKKRDDPNNYNDFAEFVEAMALQKVVDVKYQLLSYGIIPDILIGAHTIVTLDGDILGKAEDVTEASEMLSRLSGRTHTVYTGVVIKTEDMTTKFTEKTDVTFKQLTETQMVQYIFSREPIGMNGGYCISGVGATFIEKVDGDYLTVLGLPIFRLSLVLYKMCEGFI